jgi:ferredoxin, 2Fe-2S
VREKFKVNLDYGGRLYEIETYIGDYRNLMELIKDRISVSDFGDCGGLGRCGTCLVDCSGLHETTPAIDRNENATLTKMGVLNPNIHLSCQILLDKLLSNGSIEIKEIV